MAGRPASRGGGVSGVQIGLIVFVILTVASLGLFVWQLTRVEGIQKENDKLTKRLAQYGRPSNSYYETEAEGRRSSVFAVMERQLNEYGKLVSGSEEAVFPTVQTRVDAMKNKILRLHPDLGEFTNFTDFVNRLSTNLDTEKKLNSDLRDQANTAEDGLKAAIADNRTIKEDFTAQVTELTEQYEAFIAQWNSTMDDKESLLTSLSERVNQLTKQVNELDIAGYKEATAVKDELANAQDRIEDLSGKLKELQPPMFDPAKILTQADGKVINLVPGSDLVYIDIGSQDGLKVGMGFEVFSTVELARDNRGKASLEVVTVDTNFAECIVTRKVDTQPIIRGDVVVNVIFQRGRKPEFVIVGDFDFDYDGIPDVNGAEKVAALIDKWGGVVTEDVSETTDFVVAGRRPIIPRADVGGGSTDTIEEQVEGRQRALGAYRSVVKDAISRSVPAISQMQFLFLTGYAGGQSTEF